ncbi:MAG: hypothetical protein ACE5HU_04255, partial [Acidobacteriota bacterium]
MKVVRVESRRDLKAFIELPYAKYGDDPCWAPPLRIEEWEQFDPGKNPSYDHLEIDLFLAMDAGRVVGRIAAIEDHLHASTHGERVGCFGFFEAEGLAAARCLMEAAERWARGRGLSRLRGPMNPSLNQTAGLQIDAFDEPPFLLTPHTPPEYVDHMERLGYRKLKDLYAWKIDLSQPARGDLVRIAKRIRRRHGATIRSLDMRSYDREVLTILAIHSEAWADNWGFIPPTVREFTSLARKMRMLMDPRLVLFVEVEGETAGFCVTLPDLNQGLRKIAGRLLPFGWLRLLWEKKGIDRVRMPLLGIRRKYRGKGLFAPLIVESIT